MWCSRPGLPPRAPLVFSPSPTYLGLPFPRRFGLTPLFIPIYMSVSSRTASPSPDNFTAIFDSAWSEYEKVTGKRLNAHPLTAQLDSCDSPKAVLNILRTQAQVFEKERRGDEKLMEWLGPTVNILFVFSSMLMEGIGLVSILILCLTILQLTSTVGFPARQSNLCWYRCSSRGESFLCSLSCIRVRS